ncbi:MAG: gliding motility-associated C-terminal domain-containing protein [Cyclobacteriaceae bacterium]
MNKIITFIFALTATVQLYGQGFYNDNSIVSLASETIVVIPDSLVNKGTLINNGRLSISGAWVNLGTYDPGEGQINFNSNLIQTINHNDQSFGKLTISGSGEKEFLANITITSELDLQNSLLKSVDGAKIILLPDAIVNGGSDQSHIVGPVEQQGTGNLLFPIGNGVVYLPVQISGVTDSNVKATMSLHELSSGETLVGANDIVALSTLRYWELGLTDGLLTGSTLTLPLRDEDALLGEDAQLIVTESFSPLGEYQSLGQSGFTGTKSDGRVTSELAPTTTFFTVGVLNDEVSITVFNGVSPNDDGLNDYFKLFNIERFPDNKVTIFNRWGDKVFELSGYDDDTRVFKGENNLDASKKLPSGTYFYSINLGNGTPAFTGYLELKN